MVVRHSALIEGRALLSAPDEAAPVISSATANVRSRPGDRVALSGRRRGGRAIGRLSDRVVIVTGGGSGIGRAAARLFAAEGAAVAIADVQADAAEEAAAKVRADGGQALAVEVDVSSSGDAERMVERVVSELGGVDALYNNAGVDSSGDVVAGAEDDWDRCLAVNAKGTFLCSKFAAPAIERSGGGAIVNQGSVAALVGVRGFAAYCAAKGAIVSLTRAMALDLAPRGVRVNCICPGTVYTPLMEPLMRERGDGDVERGIELTTAKYPLGRLGTVEDIARVALFLVSDDAAFVTGSVYTADGGMTAQ
jgi:NAD(P)-dependent dehydrogenase (short-subunit alcohol dehydrogenase family)